MREKRAGRRNLAAGLRGRIECALTEAKKRASRKHGWRMAEMVRGKETDRIKVSNSIACAVHSSGCRGARFDAESAVTWKRNFRHPPKRVTDLEGPLYG